MKKVSIIMLLTTTFLLSYSLTIDIRGIKNTKGNIVIGIYNKKAGFREIDKVYKEVKLKLENSKKVTYTFKNIPKGEYAIALFHDQNSNNKLDKNFLGVPKEGYGFSNNIRHTLKATSFKEAKFIVVDSIKLNIKMGY